MRQLADEFDVVCSASYLVGEDIFVRERASAVSHLNWHTHPIRTVQAVFPFGGFFIAWSPPAVKAWLDVAGLDAAARAKTERGLAFLREHGFTYGVRKVPLVDPKRARELQDELELTDFDPVGLDPRETYQLAYVGAPVFSRPGTVAFFLSLSGFIGPCRGESIEQMGRRLRDACDRVGGFIAGRELV
jgi:hypothetical protein